MFIVYLPSWWLLVCFLWPPAQFRHKAVQHLRTRQHALHGRGGNVHPTEGIDRAARRRCRWWLGQSAGYYSRRIIYSPHSQEVNSNQCVWAYS